VRQVRTSALVLWRSFGRSSRCGLCKGKTRWPDRDTTKSRASQEEVAFNGIHIAPVSKEIPLRAHLPQGCGREDEPYARGLFPPEARFAKRRGKPRKSKLKFAPIYLFSVHRTACFPRALIGPKSREVSLSNEAFASHGWRCRSYALVSLVLTLRYWNIAPPTYCAYRLPCEDRGRSGELRRANFGPLLFTTKEMRIGDSGWPSLKTQSRNGWRSDEAKHEADYFLVQDEETSIRSP